MGWLVPVHYVSALYIPSYALASGLSSTQGALLLALMTVSQVVSQTRFGYLSDRRVSINLVAGSSSAVAAMAVYAYWGFGEVFRGVGGVCAGLWVLWGWVYGAVGSYYI